MSQITHVLFLPYSVKAICKKSARTISATGYSNITFSDVPCISNWFFLTFYNLSNCHRKASNVIMLSSVDSTPCK